MSLRLRLGLWYGGLTGLVVLLMSVFTYAAHTRGHYDDMDYTLQTTAMHMAQEYESGENLPGSTGSAQGTGGSNSPAVISQSLAVWIYSSQDQLVAHSPGTAGAPTVDPLEVLSHPPGPQPFDPVAGIAPHLMGTDAAHGSGAFGLITAPDGARWRYFVLPFHGGNHLLVVGASLDRIDASVASLRWLAVIVTVVGAAATLLAGWLLARRALRPVAVLTDTAGAIAHSRSLERRVPVTGDHDELGKLASTFNDMLTSLEHAYRAQQRFVSDASHEMRAPLTAIQGNLDLLDRVPDMSPEDRQEAIGEARREAHRLSRLVADLLALARADAGVDMRREPVELDRVLLQAFSEARHFARGQQMEVEELEPAVVLGDADRLKQLFLILLDNATKYTPPTGHVAVKMRRVRQGTAHRAHQAHQVASYHAAGHQGNVYGSQDGPGGPGGPGEGIEKAENVGNPGNVANLVNAGNADHVEVEVSDNGIGIPAEDLAHVFERFYRADPARGRDPGGTGLGLAIAQWIVDQLGGEISIQSQPGVGTSVTVRLAVATGTQST